LKNTINKNLPTARETQNTIESNEKKVSKMRGCENKSIKSEHATSTSAEKDKQSNERTTTKEMKF
jgi:hypothetical protein